MYIGKQGIHTEDNYHYTITELITDFNHGINNTTLDKNTKYLQKLTTPDIQYNETTRKVLNKALRQILKYYFDIYWIIKI